MAKSDLEFSNREDLRAWLEGKPIEWSQVIAARAALRVFPLGLVERPHLTLYIFRASFISWAARTYPAHDMEAVSFFSATTSFSASSFSASAAASAADSASYSADSAASYSAASAAVSSASAASAAAVSAAVSSAAVSFSLMWQTISMDAAWLEERGQEHELIHQPLWPAKEGGNKTSGGAPEWALARLSEFSNTKIGDIKHSHLILDWYRALLPAEEGQKPKSFFGEKADLAIALKLDEFWERGNDDKCVEAVLADIAKIVDGTYEGDPSLTQKKVSQETFQPTERTDVKSKSDEPTAEDELGRRPFAESLVDKINEVREAGQKDGFAVHLHAPWGAGKTSILLMMQDYMKRSDKKEAKDEDWVVVNFNAWEHERRKPPWWPLIEAVNRDCSAYLAEEAGIRSDGCIWQKKFDFFKAVKQNFCGTFRLSRRFAKQSRIRCEGTWRQKAFVWLYAFRLPFVRHPFIHQPIGQWKLQKDRWYWWKLKTDWMPFCLAFFMIGILAFLFFFDNGSNSLLSNSLKIFAGLTGVTLTFLAATQSLVFGSKENANYYFQLSNDPLGRIHSLFNKLIDGVDRPVCIFIDDLDRCHADFVVDLLEGIQSSFRHEKVTYVVAADKGWIRSAFETRYDTFKDHVGDPAQPLGYLFLEKIFQMSTPIPGMAPYVKEEYFKHLLDDKTTEGNETEPVDDYHERVESAKRELEDALPEGAPIEILKQYIEKDPTPENKAAGVRIMNKSAKAEKQSKHFLLGFKDILTGNPREMKRLLNAFEMRRTLWMVESSNVSLENIFRWTVIEQSYPALADLLSDRPDLIKHFETRPIKKDENDKKIPTDLEPFYEIDAIFEIVNGLGKTTLTEEIIHDITKGFGNYS
ncbi:MAG: P-loop NTPase fold protein [Hyphomicrobiales bacterium]